MSNTFAPINRGQYKLRNRAKYHNHSSVRVELHPAPNFLLKPLIWLIVTGIKWPPLYKRHFKKHFLHQKVSIEISIKFVLRLPIDKDTGQNLSEWLLNARRHLRQCLQLFKIGNSSVCIPVPLDVEFAYHHELSNAFDIVFTLDVFQIHPIKKVYIISALN